MQVAVRSGAPRAAFPRRPRLRESAERVPGRSSPPASVPTIALLAALVAACGTAPPRPPAAPVPLELPPTARQVEIRRTTHGVPHILAENLRAAWFALAYVQLEDHGSGIIRGMQAARGRMALVEGVERIDADARARLRHARATATFDSLTADTRDVYTGFAEGMNHFIRTHRDTLPDWVQPDFTGPDILARDIAWAQEGAMERFRERLLDDPALLALAADGEWRRAGAAAAGASRPADESGEHRPANGSMPAATAATNDGSSAVKTRRPEEARMPAAASDVTAFDADDQNVGSNAWALAPDRTTSGNAILLRNPHLSWTAGYYEAHVRVPGKLDFYGDFRIGGPFTVIGGFSPYLGFATTNNANRSHEFYAFRTDPVQPDRIVVDGSPIPLELDTVAVEYRTANGNGTAIDTREFVGTRFGPVVHRNDSLVYVFRPATHGDFRAGEQWLEMMKATGLEAWKEAMRIQARSTSNFTYADRDGNIFYVWIAAAPVLPHPAGGDTLAILATRSDQVWSEIVPFDLLPQLLNPRGGYLHNENDSPHYANMNEVMPDSFPFWVQPPRLRLRSQHGVELLHNDRVFSLEDVVEAKHSMRMLLTDRVKLDLIAAVRATSPQGEVARAIELLERWDNSVAPESRGGVLFEMWWDRYRAVVGDGDLHAVEWTPDAPLTTPHGLARADLAAEAFVHTVPEAARLFGRWDVTWGEVHRVRRGDVDVPVGGCGGALGCFRVLNFDTQPDGRRAVDGGDGWVLAVEFGDPPRAYSVLAYGQSPDTTSPYHADQAALFAAGRMKPVRWTEEDIATHTVERYRPGEEQTRR